MRIESDRLYIYPISNEEMKKMIADEKDEGLRQAYSEMLQGCINSPENRIWYAVWNMELKDRPGTIVDDLSFKGFGNGGIVEIGYGLRDGYCGNCLPCLCHSLLCALPRKRTGQSPRSCLQGNPRTPSHG